MSKAVSPAADHRLSVAPMMEWTDRHCRVFLRLISSRTRLYTEMIAADAILHGARDRLLAFDASEHPVALQLGGSDPDALARAAEIGAGFGYDEINLNVGCPSDRVQSGRFGACLMAEPELVADCVRAMKRAVDVPVTVKCRIGIDDQDSETALSRFAEAQVAVGADAIIVHARKAWLKGLSPKQNRDIPPLDYDRVHRLKRAMPDVTVVINGGIPDLDAAERHLAHVDGVMLGRAAYNTPYVLAEADRRLFGERTPPLSRSEIVDAFLPYVERRRAQGTPLNAMTRHVLGLYHGEPGARLWRRTITEAVSQADTGPEVLQAARDAVEAVRARARDAVAA